LLLFSLAILTEEHLTIITSIEYKSGTYLADNETFEHHRLLYTSTTFTSKEGGRNQQNNSQLI